MVHLKLGPWELAMVRGDTLELPDCRLTPIAHYCSFRRRRATIGQVRIRSFGMKWVRIVPDAVLVERRGTRRVLFVPDLTRLTLGILASLGVLSTMAACALSRKLEGNGQCGK